ncbi:MAG: Lrp/AsnC ligand binding domain-containing protein [Desulfococcaceae bacterium]|jgi:DNA-binding Lrp family transcriptional regulator|nr:Lrp/AsnC ligand binding domain-containing protein [Desulfococcaceae bacterium]
MRKIAKGEIKLFENIRKSMEKRRNAKLLKSFKEQQENEEAFDTRDLGLRDVEVDKIVGSVGRYHDFDSRFRPRTGMPSERLSRIKEAVRDGKPLPPVLLYQIKDEYYILDGNHRVAVIKQLGRKTISARILEFLPSRKTLKNVLYREKVDFMEKTGLENAIELTEVGQYSCLLEQMEEHQKSLETVQSDPLSFEAAAKDWYETIYLPFLRIIERSHLSEAFPKRTIADLYVYISMHQWKGGREREFGIGLDQIIPRNMEEFRAKMAEKKGFDFPEMKRMITAFIFISVTVGEEYRIMEKIYSIDEVREIYDVPGDFDLLAKVVMERDWLSSDSEVIGYFVYNRIRKIPGVRKTQTLIPIISKRK